MGGIKLVRPSVRKAEMPERAQGSVVRRIDFNYMGGHGTFYRFDEENMPDNLFGARRGDHLTTILYNLNTDQLDEVVFELESYSKISENCTWIYGYIVGSKDCYQIKIRYYHDRPLKSNILVSASARPDYDYIARL